MARTKFQNILDCPKKPKDICGIVNPTNALEISKSSHYVLSVRTMYKFDTTDKLFADLLNLNADDQNGFNVNNVMSIARKHCCGLRIRMVVGTDIPNTYQGGGSGNNNDYNPKMTNEHQNCSFKKNLEKLKIEYQEVSVIQIHNWQIGEVYAYNSIRILLTELHLQGIKIIGYYIGEPCYTTPLVNCDCGSLATKFKFEILASIIEVNESQLQAAVDIIASIDLKNYTLKSCYSKPLPPVVNDIPVVPNYGTNPNITKRWMFFIETDMCRLLDLFYESSKQNSDSHIQIFLLGGFGDTLQNGNLLTVIAVGTIDPRYVQSGGAGIPINPDLSKNNDAQMKSFIDILNKQGIKADIKLSIQYFDTQATPGIPGSLRKPISAIVYGGYDLQYKTTASAPYILPAEYCPCSYFQFKVSVQSDIFIVPPENINAAIQAILSYN